MKFYPIFHISLLEPYKKSIIAGRVQVPTFLIVIDDKEKFEVLEILDFCIHH